MTNFKTICSQVFYPIVLIGGFILYLFLVERGYNARLLLILSIPSSFFLVLLAENIIPERKDWLSSFELNDITDFIHLGLSKIGNKLAGTLAPLAAYQLNTDGFSLWPEQISFWLQVLLFFLIADLMEYTRHRMSHEFKVLWRFHAIHHSAQKMNVFRSGRFHIIDIAFAGFLVNLPLLLLGAPKELFLYHGLIIVLQNSLAHANINMASPKWFTSVILTNAHHFLHHNIEISNRNKNYAGIFTLWDRVFKTYASPRDISNLELGVEGYHYPKNLFHQIVKPFHKPFN